MPAVPRQQVVHAVHSRKGHMKRINTRFLWQGPMANQIFGEDDGGISDVHDCCAGNRLESFSRSLRITGRRLVHHELGDIEIEVSPARPPVA